MFQSIFSYLKNRNKRLLRHKIGAYEIFEKRGESQIVNQIFTKLKTGDVIAPMRFMGTTLSSNTVEEYLSYRLFNRKLSSNIYLSLSNPDKWMLPNNLPRAWRKLLHKQFGIRSSCLSFLRWRASCMKQLFFCLAYGVMVITRVFVTQRKDKSSCIYLHGLSSDNISSHWHETNYNIVSFFKTLRSAKTILANTNATTIKDDNTVIRVVSPFDHIRIYRLPEIILFMLALVIFSLISVTAGRGFLAFLSIEILKIHLANLLNKESICKEYAFYNSWSIYRPAWTYSLEKKGALITLYFYSVNCLPLNIDGKMLDTHFSYKRMAWTNYLVWNEDMGKFLLNNTQPVSKFEIVNPVTFSDNNAQTPFMKNKVVVFDVTPTRHALFSQFAPLTNYYSAKTKTSFLNDIIELAEELGIELVFKRKRSLSATTSKRYQKSIQQLEKFSFIQLAHPDISAHRLIRDCRAVISMPFTSTAHIGVFYDKPSIFYDGTGRISDSEPAALGLPMISRKSDLRRWLQSIY
jgi:polysaccharide biosynthesis PFTS motif protein